MKKFFSFFVSKFLRLHESATAGRPLISYSPHTVLLSSTCPFDFRSSKHSHRVTLLTLKHQDIRKLKFTKMTNDHYDVGKILDKRLYCDQVQYKIQWKNYSSTCSEWVNENDCRCAKLIRKYESERLHHFIGMNILLYYLF